MICFQAGTVFSCDENNAWQVKHRSYIVYVIIRTGIVIFVLITVLILNRAVEILRECFIEDLHISTRK